MRRSIAVDPLPKVLVKRIGAHPDDDPNDPDPYPWNVCIDSINRIVRAHKSRGDAMEHARIIRAAMRWKVKL